MVKYPMIVAGAGLVAGGAQAASKHGRMAGSELMPMAKVTLATARATALHSRPGRITVQELEREGGGSGLRYSFDVASRGKTYEVGVDAKTGAVLENKPEGDNSD
ncbi:MAG: PepSY domain-containing protein [Sphingomonadaceae bacterium]|nr:PepSY domain-containing protein [Sphingomonadaceae bacterium]